MSKKLVDMVIYTQNKHLLFVQVSKSKYDERVPKRDDLFKTLYTENGKDVSIMEHFCRLTSTPALLSNQNGKVWAKSKIAYFYVTATSDREKRRFNILNEKNYLNKLNGWNLLKQKLEID